MFIRRVPALVVAILWLWLGGVYAQSEALTEAYEQGGALYQAGQYEQAIPFWQKALELGEREFGPEHPDIAKGLNNLALLYAAQAHYAEAEPLYKRALAILEEALGPDHPNIATSLIGLALLYRARGHYEAAVPLYQRSLAILEKALGNPTGQVFVAQANARLHRVT